MRAVLQRVSRASVHVDGSVRGEIGSGLLVLLAIEANDSRNDADYLAGKIVDLRIFEDSARKMNLSVRETGGSILVVSQFTLYGDTSKGRRPSFDRAAPPEQAQTLYDYFLGKLRQTGIAVEQGVFQASMSVSLVNEGPVTLICESK